MWPVLQRELREQARQNGTFYLRMIAAGVVTLLFWLAWEREANGGVPNGRGYFLGLHRLLFLGIWFAAPVLTADCLSRERREGTLGLLFLTPLRAVDVVVGKAFVHALRGLVFVLAAIPVMVVPVLLGGVGWHDAVRMMLLQLAALGPALVAGLAASSVTESWWRARILAFLFALLAAGVFVVLYLGIQSMASGLFSRAAAGSESIGERFATLLGHLLTRQSAMAAQGFNGFWQDFHPVPAGRSAVRQAFLVMVMSWSLAGLAVGLAAMGVRRTWRQSSSSARVESVQRWFTEVHLFRSWWNRRQASMLSGNPVRWLQSRTWGARLGGWALFGIALALAGSALEAPRNAVEGYYFFGRTVLLGAVAFAAAASFRQERESGALELWLVTPLEPGAVVRGRVAGLLTRFLAPALILLLLPHLRFLWRLYLMAGNGGNPRPNYLFLPSVDWLFAGWMVATLVFGIGLSLSRLSFLTTFALSWVAHHAPFVVTAVLDWANDEMNGKLKWGIPGWSSDGFYYGFSWGLAAGVTIWGAWFARRQLAERRYLPGWSRADLSGRRKLREVPAP